MSIPRPWLDWQPGFVAFVAIAAPWPLGANRPDAWLAWTALIGLAFALRLLDPAPMPRMPVAILGLMAVVPGYALLQSVTLPGQALPLSVLPDASRLGSLRLLAYMMYFVLAADLARAPKRLARALELIFLGIVAHATGALLLASPGHFGAAEGGPPALSGFFANRNSFAFYLGLGLIVGLAHPARDTVGRVARGIGLGVILIALLATQSRAGLAASFAGAGVVLCLVPTAGQAFARRTGVALAGLGLLWIGGHDVAERFVLFEVSAQGRIALYQQVLDMIRARPLAGHGFDSFAVAFQQVHAEPVSTAVTWDLAHNSYLTLWSDLGVVVGSLPPVLLGWVGLRAGIAWRTEREGFAAPLALGVLTLGALHSLVDFSLEIPANVFVFLALIAPVVAQAGGRASRAVGGQPGRLKNIKRYQGNGGA